MHFKFSSGNEAGLRPVVNIKVCTRTPFLGVIIHSYNLKSYCRGIWWGME